MNPGHVISIVFQSSLFGVLFGAFTTIFVLGKIAFTTSRGNHGLNEDKLMWGFTCSVVFGLSLIPLACVVREIWAILF